MNFVIFVVFVAAAVGRLSEAEPTVRVLNSESRDVPTVAATKIRKITKTTKKT